MITAIVYCSKTGFTQNYAAMLSKKTGLPCCSLEKALKTQKPEGAVLFLGWLSAGAVKGYKKAAAAFPVEGVCAVGVMPGTPASIAKRNGISCPVFPLPGGVDYQKLRGVDRLALKFVAKTVGGKTPGNEKEAKIFAALRDGGDLTDPACLADVLSFLQTATVQDDKKEAF